MYFYLKIVHFNFGLKKNKDSLSDFVQSVWDFISYILLSYQFFFYVSKTSNDIFQTYGVCVQNTLCLKQYAFIILLHGYFILSGNYDLEFSKSNILKYTDTRKKRYYWLKHNELFQHMKKLPSWSRMDIWFIIKSF